MSHLRKVGAITHFTFRDKSSTLLHSVTQEIRRTAETYRTLKTTTSVVIDH